ncbi:hypothetical protein VCHA29O37_360036 [Vibrio chagasii]|nr:hypothetical protein VCHA29O37_360036 [Vibrio chagasii]
MVFSDTIKDFVKVLATLSVFQVLLITQAESDTLIGLSLILSVGFLFNYVIRKLRS